MNQVPDLLRDAPAFLFFTGKGGVGKTSLACASAVRLAEQGKRVLLVSTDPASNVGQVFSITIGARITPVPGVPRLAALEIDPQAAAATYRERIVSPVRGVLPAGVVARIEEQLSGACTTEIAAFDEFTALLTDPATLADYDTIVFDTAPTGHTIRLLQLPGAWSSYLNAGQGDASCLGPLAGLEKQRTRYHAAVEALADPARTRMVLVARAQRSALAEVARTREELATLGFSNQVLAINGVLPASEATHDPLAHAIVQREQAALEAMPVALRALPAVQIPLLPVNLVGLPALRQLLDPPSPHTASLDTVPPRAALADAPDLKALIDALEGDGHGLIMLMGKGGVGKTTLAAAIALELARRGHAVHLTTSDPAAHLEQTLADLPASEATARPLTLRISRIDPHSETERYRAEVLAARGKNLDAQGRAMLEEDLRSPCTEEIAVFQAFSRTIREAARSFVVMDTAPTGHTLLLLDATGAYHRDTVRQMGKTGMSFKTPMMQLQDSGMTKVLIATLPETTPVLEAQALQQDLERAGIRPWAWVVNQSLALARTASPLLQQRGASELQQIESIASAAPRWAGVALQAEEPVSAIRLRALLQHAH